MASVTLANQENVSTSKKDSSHPDHIAPCIHPERLAWLKEIWSEYPTSEDESVGTSVDIIQDKLIQNYIEILEHSQRARKIVGQKNRLESRRFMQKNIKKNQKPIKTFGTQTEGIEGSEMKQQKAAGEYQHCGWPRNRIGSHKTFDCFRCTRLEKRTAPFLQKK